MENKPRTQPGEALKRKRVGDFCAASKRQLQRRLAPKHELQVEKGVMRQQVRILDQQGDAVAIGGQDCEGVKAALNLGVLCGRAGPSHLLHEPLQVERWADPKDARAPFRENSRSSYQHVRGFIRAGEQQGSAAAQMLDELVDQPKPILARSVPVRTEVNACMLQVSGSFHGYSVP